MGMFDKPKYLTGEDGYVNVGDTFFLHNARIDGQSNVGGERKDQAKLLVSRTKDGPTEVVFTSGTGIVGQVRRMDADDRAAMPIEVRLDEVPSNKGNPTKVLTPASQAPPSSASSGDDIPF